MIEIIIKIPDDKVNELEGLISALTKFGNVLPGKRGVKAPAAPVKRTKAQIVADTQARLNKKYNN